MAFQLPRDVSFAADGLFEPCAASPMADGDFQGLLVNAPPRVTSASSEALEIPLRGYLRLPYDFGGFGDSFVEALSFVVVSHSPFSLAVTGLSLPGTPLESLEVKAPRPGLLVGKYFNPSLAIAATGVSFVYVFLGPYVSNVVRVDVVAEGAS